MVQAVKTPEAALAAVAAAPCDAAHSITTPVGLQANAALTLRRLMVLTLNAATWLALLGWAASILASGGWTPLDCALLVCVALGTPWSVLGFWNAAIGLWLLHGRSDGASEAAPYLAAGERPLAITSRTAVVMTLRNEDPQRAILRLKTVQASLDATGEGPRFSYFVLSDTDRADIATAEEAAVEAWRSVAAHPERIVYRRRAANCGFKAGNVRAFCETQGRAFDFMLPLDADSLMTGPAILRFVRIMQAHPEIGILQSLVVGAPSSSAFARIFQFGMRHGMRAYTMGQAWWAADCGPYWGHNALVRIRPFSDFCRLPVLPGPPPLGGPVLSHDQVEAVLMRRAGYDVRVAPVECGSFEDNPPDALEFLRRDSRWCLGNMQYLKLIDLPGLNLVSRIQLAWAVAMFVNGAVWTFMIGALPFAAADAVHIANFPADSAKSLYVAILLMYLSPKLAGYIDAVLTPGQVERYGGHARFSVSAAIEIVFSFLQGALSTLRTSMVLLGLPFGKTIAWSGQRRDARGLSWRAAARALWPQVAFGAVVCGALLVVSPATLLWSLPLTAGYLLAIPFAVVTADPRLGAFLVRNGVAGVPEDFDPPPEIVALRPRGAR